MAGLIEGERGKASKGGRKVGSKGCGGPSDRVCIQSYTVRERREGKKWRGLSMKKAEKGKVEPEKDSQRPRA